MASDLNDICRGIGTRFVGTEGERKAIEFMARRFREAGVGQVTFHDFSLKAWDYTKAELVRLDGGRGTVPCMPVSYTASTPEGGIERPLVYIHTGTRRDLERQDLGGKIGLMSGSFGGSHSPKAGEDKFRRFLGSGMDGLILIEDRCPTDWVRAEGIPPFWFRHGSIPMVSVSFEEGLALVQDKVQRVRLDVQATSVHAHSSNVIAEVEGTAWPKQVIVLSCHHDTVPGSIGACDNGTGMIMALEIARLLKAMEAKRTVRLISFGSEEQLSVGATRYVEEHRDQMPQIVLAINLDGIGPFLGEATVMVTGTGALKSWAKSVVTNVDHPAEGTSGVSPFSDHFPFTMHGVPTVWFAGRRPNFVYHSREDVPEQIDMDFVGATVHAAIQMILDLDTAHKVPFPRGLTKKQTEETQKLRKELYGIQD